MQTGVRVSASRGPFSALLALLLTTAGCGGGGGGGGTEPSVPATIVVVPGTITFTALGQTLLLTPSVRDQNGSVITGQTVTWQTGDAAVATVSSSGVVTAVGVGTTEVTASVGAAQEAVTVTVTQVPALLEKVAGDGQSAAPGATVATPPAVRVRDGLGSPISGLEVVFAVAAGGGSVTGGTATTNGNGVAQVGSWTLGSAGLNAVTATVSGATFDGNPATFFTCTSTSAFDIQIRFVGSTTLPAAAAFCSAAARWEDVITADLQNVQVQVGADQCATGVPAINEQVDDLVIYATIVEIDGPGSILGQAGPCIIRLNNLPAVGVMQFDEADVESLQGSGLLEATILHEMGHVLGVGTLWPLQGLLVGAGGNDPHFIGAQAIGAFDAVGGSSYSGGAKVPVENTGSEGTRDAHWRESVLLNELMTGFISPATNPLSRLTIASLADQGYTVDLGKADAFSISPSLRAQVQAGSILLENDLLPIPIRQLDAAGHVVRVIRP